MDNVAIAHAVIAGLVVVAVGMTFAAAAFLRFALRCQTRANYEAMRADQNDALLDRKRRREAGLPPKRNALGQFTS